MTEDIADRLARIPTTIACDILKGEPLAERVATGLMPMTPASAMAGPVRIITFLPGRPELRKPGPPANFAVTDAVTAGEVLVLCAGGSMAGAVLGDMLATRARQRGRGGLWWMGRCAIWTGWRCPACRCRRGAWHRWPPMPA